MRSRKHEKKKLKLKKKQLLKITKIYLWKKTLFAHKNTHTKKEALSMLQKLKILFMNTHREKKTEKEDKA